MDAVDFALPLLASITLGTAILVPIRDGKRGRRATLVGSSDPLRPDFRELKSVDRDTANISLEHADHPNPSDIVSQDADTHSDRPKRVAPSNVLSEPPPAPTSAEMRTVAPISPKGGVSPIPGIEASVSATNTNRIGPISAEVRIATNFSTDNVDTTDRAARVLAMSPEQDDFEISPESVEVATSPADRDLTICYADDDLATSKADRELATSMQPAVLRSTIDPHVAVPQVISRRKSTLRAFFDDVLKLVRPRSPQQHSRTVVSSTAADTHPVFRTLSALVSPQVDSNEREVDAPIGIERSFADELEALLGNASTPSFEATDFENQDLIVKEMQQRSTSAPPHVVETAPAAPDNDPLDKSLLLAQDPHASKSSRGRESFQDDPRTEVSKHDLIARQSAASSLPQNVSLVGAIAGAQSQTRFERIVPLTRLPLRPRSSAVTWSDELVATADIVVRHGYLERAIADSSIPMPPSTLREALAQEDEAGRLLVLRIMRRRDPSEFQATFVTILRTGSDDERLFAVNALIDIGALDGLPPAFEDRVDAIAANAALAFVGSRDRGVYRERLCAYVDSARTEAILALLGGILE